MRSTIQSAVICGVFADNSVRPMVHTRVVDLRLVLVLLTGSMCVCLSSILYDAHLHMDLDLGQLVRKRC